MDHELLWGTLGGLLLALIHWGPSPAGLPLPCFFKLLSGFPCPTCGMTRAWIALGQGEWTLALRMHPGLALGYFFLWGYLPYALGSVLGVWPRLGVALSPFGVRMLRILILFAFAALWGFLVWDAR